MFKRSTILLASFLSIPSIYAAKPSDEYQKLVDDYKKKLGELRESILKVRNHPESKDNLYGLGEKEFSRFDEDDKGQSSGGLNNTPPAQGNWPLRIVLSLLGGGVAFAVGSYWMPDTALPVKRTAPATDELYQSVKRKYRVLDDEEDEY